MRLPTRTTIALIALAAGFTAGPAGAATTKCTYRGLGGYDQVEATGVSCTFANGVVKRWNSFCAEHGTPDGLVCTVKGLRCVARRRETPGSSGENHVEIKTRCAKGSNKVSFRTQGTAPTGF